MRVADRLAKRERAWQELDVLLTRFDHRSLRRRTRPGREIVWIEEGADPLGPAPSGKPGFAEVIRLGELYRSACADLMLAEAHDLPRDTVAYLHALVGRAHNALYRSRGFRFGNWASELLRTVPRQLRADPALRISIVLFYGTFLIFGLLAAARPEIAATVAGESYLTMMEEMYAEPVDGLDRNDAAMTGFYILNNAGIGLRCFALGLSFGLGTIWTLFSSGMILGVTFGHMATTPYAEKFYTFVTAHGPFELTAIVFAGAAGLRVGWGVVKAVVRLHVDSLRQEAHQALPTAGAAVFLFLLAAFLEGFVSASPIPYPFKAAIALFSAVLLVVYLALGGRDHVG
ncbi:stage II sporulation protein M [soil metagenome]